MDILVLVRFNQYKGTKITCDYFMKNVQICLKFLLNSNNQKYRCPLPLKILIIKFYAKRTTGH